MHRPAAPSQRGDPPSHQFGERPQSRAPPRSSAASYGSPTSQFRAPPTRFEAPPVVSSPPQLLSPEAPWEEGRFNFEEDGRRTPERNSDFFDNFPVEVDQTDPELERAVNDFAHSFESIKQVK